MQNIVVVRKEKFNIFELSMLNIVEIARPLRNLVKFDCFCSCCQFTMTAVEDILSRIYVVGVTQEYAAGESNE